MYSSLNVITKVGSGTYVTANKKPDNIWKIMLIRMDKPKTDENLKYGIKIIHAYFIKK